MPGRRVCYCMIGSNAGTRCFLESHHSRLRIARKLTKRSRNALTRSLKAVIVRKSWRTSLNDCFVCHQWIGWNSRTLWATLSSTTSTFPESLKTRSALPRHPELSWGNTISPSEIKRSKLASKLSLLQHLKKTSTRHQSNKSHLCPKPNEKGWPTRMF